MTSLDQDLFLEINAEWTSPVLDWWGALVRAPEVWLLPALLVVAVALVRGTPKVRATAVLAVLVLVLGDLLFVRTGKLVFARPRPDAVLVVRSVRLADAHPRLLAIGMPVEVRTVKPHPAARARRSFPSGHAWNAFAVATVIALCCRRMGWIAFPIAAAIGYARISAGLHWPSDILVTALLSVPATYLVMRLVDRAWRRLHAGHLGRLRWARDLPRLLGHDEPQHAPAPVAQAQA